MDAPALWGRRRLPLRSRPWPDEQNVRCRSAPERFRRSVRLPESVRAVAGRLGSLRAGPPQDQGDVVSGGTAPSTLAGKAGGGIQGAPSARGEHFLYQIVSHHSRRNIEVRAELPQPVDAPEQTAAGDEARRVAKGPRTAQRQWLPGYEDGSLFVTGKVLVCQWFRPGRAGRQTPVCVVSCVAGLGCKALEPMNRATIGR